MLPFLKLLRELAIKAGVIPKRNFEEERIRAFYHQKREPPSRRDSTGSNSGGGGGGDDENARTTVFGKEKAAPGPKQRGKKVRVPPRPPCRLPFTPPFPSRAKKAKASATLRSKAR